MLLPMFNVTNIYINSSRSLCAVSNMAVYFCSSTISCFPGIMLKYCLSYFEMVQFAPIITGITSVFAFYRRSARIYIVRSLYFRIFSAFFLITFLFPQIATSINIRVSYSFIPDNDNFLTSVLLRMFLSAFTWTHTTNVLILTFIAFPCSLSGPTMC